MALNALFTGATGLTTNSTALDIVGNNLANLNTTGYKTQRPLFRDLFYQTLLPGSPATGVSGGANGTQLGFGVGIGAIDNILQQGAVNPTGRPLDAAIQGSGFFILNNGGQTVYSRAGTFSIDSAGFLVDPSTGARVQRTGSLGETTGTTPGFQVPGDQNIRVPIGAGASGLPTTSVTFQRNLSNTLPVGQGVTTAIQVFDSQSTSRPLTVTFTKTATNEFTVSAVIPGGTVAIPPTPVQFDNNGLLVGPASLTATITGLPGVAAQTVTLNLGTPGQATGLTQFGGASDAAAVTQDGTGAGTLTSVAIDNDGILQGQFSNGRTIPVAQLAIAGFNNEAGLLRSGSNFFLESPSSGAAVIGPAGTGGRGTVQGSALEGSNVDIAIEFSRLIVAQRGFQVNARTITAANETLQELASIVR